MSEAEQLAEHMRSYLERILELIEEYGWAVQAVAPTQKDVDSTPFCYTVGLTARDLPELIMFGLPPQVATPIMNRAARRLLDGFHPEPGEKFPGLVEGGFDPVVHQTEDHGSHVTVANAIYGADAVRAWQLVFPDKDKRYPWDDGYALTGQPLI